MLTTACLPTDDHPKLNLTAEEKRLYGQLFKEADPNNTGFITGEVAVNFFGRTQLPQQLLGAIWDLVDPDNRGFLLQEDFAKAMRLIGYSQANPNRSLDLDLTLKPSPLPLFQGVNMPTGIRVPPLSPDDATKYMKLFEQSGATNGIIGGDSARQFFMRSGLPNDILISVWNLADQEQRGALGMTHFIVAMHLLTSYKNGTMTALPKQCPPALFEAAARMSSRTPAAAPSAIPRQFSGQNSQRTASPASRSPYAAPPPSNEWVVAPLKPAFDEAFEKLDPQHTGFVPGDQAANYFRHSNLPEGILAQIWDLANIRKADQLNRDEFAVAMYLIRTQRAKDRVDLPSALPLNLIPPSLRPAAATPAQTTIVPTTQAPPQKSAAEDLFGLDEISAPSAAPVLQQTTGGSGPFGDNYGSKTSSPIAPQTSGFQAARGFKPFVPTSSFGQNLQAQNTGGSATSSSRDFKPSQLQHSAMDDLLGDADPEVSKKLTPETSELANLSNQMGQLRNQMQDVQAKKGVSERDLLSTNTQKRDIELRLGQFRSQYEQEVKAVKAIEEQLATSRSETQNLQRELAMVEGSYQDLQNQHRQAATALENERRENSALKDRLSQLTQEISRLRPELEKLRSDEKREKGMTSINKKQLERSETERDSMKSEIETLRSAPESSRDPVATSRENPTSVVSPALSTASQSTNPFFRRSPQPSFDNTASPASFTRSPPAQESNKGFDSLWGTAFGTSSPAASGPPAATFGGFSSQSGPSMSSSEHNVPTPSASPPTSSYRDSPRAAAPPELPQSRQITSSELPIRSTGTESSASMRVEPPASRWEGTATPTAPSTVTPALERADTASSTGAAMFDRNTTASPVASVTSDASKARAPEQNDISRGFQAPGSIPGAFPGTQTSPLQSQLTGESSFTTGSKETSRGDQREGMNRGLGTGNKMDFDSAFASQSRPAGANGGFDDMRSFGSRFPPIRSLEPEDDSDSDTEPEGFDDDFTAASPERKRNVTTVAAPSAKNEPAPAKDDNESFRPRTATSADPADLPGISAQKSPPDYTASPTGPGGSTHETSTGFPPEFGGLLPSREMAASPPQPAQSPSQGAALFGGSPGAKTNETTSSSTAPSGDYQSAVSQPSVVTERSTGPTTSASHGQQSVASFGADDDFDAGFDDLEDAKAGDDKDDDLFSSTMDQSYDDFNPNFDSPMASKSNT